MMKFSDSGLLSTAKELTELAIQNGFIAKCSEADETAKNVSLFFQTLLNELNPKINIL